MVEFGEKVKQLREEKGMTQQTMAEKLYVTRQAVSRWECGARYPDLHTAKKIAQILQVSLDELLSGEELKENIEKEPVLSRQTDNMIQAILYAVAAISYLLLCLFSLYSCLRPNQALANTPAGKITIIIIFADIMRVVSFTGAFIGFVLAVKNKLTARATGFIMFLPYLLAALNFMVTYMDMQIKGNGYIGIEGWVTEFIIPLLLAIYVLLFFERRERRLPYVIIWGICILTGAYLVYTYKNRLSYATDLGFVVTTVTMAGKLGMAALLGYQAYVWDKKKRVACDIGK